jgi:hypothetical protein
MLKNSQTQEWNGVFCATDPRLISPEKPPFKCEAESHPEDNTEQDSMFDARARYVIYLRGLHVKQPPTLWAYA